MAQELLIGIDLIEVKRIEKAYRRWRERFLQRVYTEEEIESCGGHLPSLAARFAIKEAVAKALGLGIGEISWREIETLRDPQGKPLLRLSGKAQARAEEMGVRKWAISLSHTREAAIAIAIGLG